MEPLAALPSGLLSCADDRLAVADQRDLGRLVLVHRLRLDVELDHPHVLGVARRQAEMQDPVEARAHQENDVRLLQREAARRAGRQRVVVRHHALALGRCARTAVWVRSMNARTSSSALRVGHALADKGERALRRLQHVESMLDVRSASPSCAAGRGISATSYHRARRRTSR